MSIRNRTTTRGVFTLLAYAGSLISNRTGPAWEDGEDVQPLVMASGPGEGTMRRGTPEFVLCAMVVFGLSWCLTSPSIAATVESETSVVCGEIADPDAEAKSCIVFACTATADSALGGASASTGAFAIPVSPVNTAAIAIFGDKKVRATGRSATGCHISGEATAKNLVGTITKSVPLAAFAAGSTVNNTVTLSFGDQTLSASTTETNTHSWSVRVTADDPSLGQTILFDGSITISDAGVTTSGDFSASDVIVTTPPGVITATLDKNDLNIPLTVSLNEEVKIRSREIATASSASPSEFGVEDCTVCLGGGMAAPSGFTIEAGEVVEEDPPVLFGPTLTEWGLALSLLLMGACLVNRQRRKATA